MSDQKKLSGAAAFRARAKKQDEGEMLELSSGMVIRIRRPNENKLIQNGEIPAALVMSSVNVQLQRPTPNDLVGYAKLQRLYVRLAVVDPVIVEGEPSNDNEVSADAFNTDELQEIYTYVAGGMDGLRRFREERQRIFAGSAKPEIPGDTSERPVRTEEPGQS